MLFENRAKITGGMVETIQGKSICKDFKRFGSNLYLGVSRGIVKQQRKNVNRRI